MRLIDADALINKLKRNSIFEKITDSRGMNTIEIIEEQPTAYDVEKLKHYQLGNCMNDCEHYKNCSNYIYSKGYNKAIDDVTKLVEFLIADLDVEGCTKYGNENAEQEKKSYDTLMKYEIAGSIDDLLDRLERLKS